MLELVGNESILKLLQLRKCVQYECLNGSPIWEVLVDTGEGGFLRGRELDKGQG